MRSAIDSAKSDSACTVARSVDVVIDDVVVPADNLVVPAGGFVGGAAVAISSIFWMTTGASGESCLNGPTAPVGETLMRSTTSMPSTTLPKTA